MKPIIISLGFTALATLAIFAVVDYHPLHMYSVVLLSLIYCSPIILVAGIVLARVGVFSKKTYAAPPMDAQPRKGRSSNYTVVGSRADAQPRKGQHINYAILFTMSCIAFSIGAVVFLNARLDTSEAKTEIVPVIEKGSSTSRHSTNYYAVIASPRPPVIAVPFDATEHVSLRNYAAYQAVRIGQDKAQIVIREGFLGLPWIVSSRYLPANDGPSAGSSGVPAGPITGYQLALTYLQGTGNPKDYQKAAEIFRACGEQGDMWCQHDLGSMYSYGQGVPRDDTEAAKWVGRSARQGLAMSQGDMGLLYGDGRGVPQDWIECYKWLTLGARGGFAQAQKDLSFAAAHMTQDQIAEAVRRADAFVAVGEAPSGAATLIPR